MPTGTKLSERSDFALGPKVYWPMKRKLSNQHQVIIPDVLYDDMLAFMQDKLMVPVNNLDEIRVKPELSLRTPLDETKMEPDCDQQMELLSTLKLVASSYDHVGTREPPK